MTLVFLVFAVFFSIIQILVIVDIVLSWVSVFVGRPIRIGIVSDIVDPLREWVARYFPTRLGPLDFWPVVIILACELVIMILVSIDPGILAYLPR